VTGGFVWRLKPQPLACRPSTKSKVNNLVQVFVCVSYIHEPAYPTCELPPLHPFPSPTPEYLFVFFFRFPSSSLPDAPLPYRTHEASASLVAQPPPPPPLVVLLQRPARHRSSMLVALLDCTAGRNLYTEISGARRGVRAWAVSGRRRRDLGAAIMSPARVH
jgi:hypothetical protein